MKMWRKQIRKSEYICQSKSLSFEKLTNTNSISSMICTCILSTLGCRGEHRKEVSRSTQALAPGASPALSRDWLVAAASSLGWSIPALLSFSSGLGREKHITLEGADLLQGRVCSLPQSLWLEKMWIRRTFLRAVCPSNSSTQNLVHPNHTCKPTSNVNSGVLWWH